MADVMAPRVLVTLENTTGDNTEYVVQTDNRDMVRWDIMRNRKGWPDAESAAFLFLSVLAWSALERTGETALKVDEFLAVAADVAPADEDGNRQDLDDLAGDGHIVDPTRPAAATT